MKIVIPITIDDSVFIDSNVPENDKPAYDPNATYAKDAQVISTHKVYCSLVDNNKGNAVTDISKWSFMGSSNRWRMHDQKLQVQTTNAGSIQNTYQISTPINCISLLNISAATLRAVMVDNNGQPVWDSKDISLVSASGIQEMYSYFFEPIARKTDLMLANIPLYANARLIVTLTEPQAGQVRCGEIILGTFRDIGATLYGAKLGITDYSVKTQDGFGNYTIIERPYRRTGDFIVQVQKGYVDQLHNLMASRRAKPTLYIGADDYGASMIYGFFKDFNAVINYPMTSQCAISIEGLT